jgi:hypothetical protein
LALSPVNRITFHQLINFNTFDSMSDTLSKAITQQLSPDILPDISVVSNKEVATTTATPTTEKTTDSGTTTMASNTGTTTETATKEIPSRAITQVTREATTTRIDIPPAIAESPWWSKVEGWDNLSIVMGIVITIVGTVVTVSFKLGTHTNKILSRIDEQSRQQAELEQVIKQIESSLEKLETDSKHRDQRILDKLQDTFAKADRKIEEITVNSGIQNRDIKALKHRTEELRGMFYRLIRELRDNDVYTFFIPRSRDEPPIEKESNDWER